MQESKEIRKPPSRSTSKSPLVSPSDEPQDPISRKSTPTPVAFVPFDPGTSSGVSHSTRRAVRIQAAKASATTRKRTIAKKLAGKKSTSFDEAGSSLAVEDERGRRASVPSPGESSPLKPTASPSPARSVSGEQLEPFRPYPVPRWHPQIPALVDHFLKYFAPDTSANLHGREDLRTQLWPDATNDTSLFHAFLLTVASHASASRAQGVPTQLLASFKHTAIESINESVTRSEDNSGISDAVVGAIALLGAWELDYGNPLTYETHMRGLETIVDLRGGLYGDHTPAPGFTPLPPAIANLVLNSGNDLALYAGRRPHFVHEDAELPVFSTTLSATLSAGFASLTAKRLLLPSLVELARRLAVLSARDQTTSKILEETYQALTDWSLSSATRASYCASQTLLEDNMKHQASKLVRLAGLATCAFLRLNIGIDMQQRIQSLYDEALQTLPELLVNTVYEEVAFWALFVLCAITGQCEARHMRALKRLQLEQGLQDWSEARVALGRYVYHPTLLDGRSYPLWEAISNSKIAKESTANAREPTRFAKGIQLPTTSIGDAISAELG